MEKFLKLDKIKDEFLANTSHELRTSFENDDSAQSEILESRVRILLVDDDAINLHH